MPIRESLTSALLVVSLGACATGGMSSGDAITFTASALPVNRPAATRRCRSPITRGRKVSCSSRCARPFMTISGPTPAASPMVMPMTGRFDIANRSVAAMTAG